MPESEALLPPHPDQPEVSRAAPPQRLIPGFESLPKDRQDAFLRIGPRYFEQARPLIEAEIAAIKAANEKDERGRSAVWEGQSLHAVAAARETQALAAIDAFHRAERGDPEAKKDLEDHKKELFGEEPDDDTLFRTILETESSDPFARDTAMEVMLSDAEARETQAVLDLFQAFRGDLPSADNALPPRQQIDLFLRLTKGMGPFRERLDFARHALTLVTDDGQRNLFEGLMAYKVVTHRDLSDPAIDALREGTRRHLADEVVGSEDAA